MTDYDTDTDMTPDAMEDAYAGSLAVLSWLDAEPCLLSYWSNSGPSVGAARSMSDYIVGIVHGLKLGYDMREPHTGESPLWAVMQLALLRRKLYDFIATLSRHQRCRTDRSSGSEYLN